MTLEMISKMTAKITPKKINGFTLIELLVVSTITVLLLLSVSSMLMTFMLSNAKTNISRQIKAEGNEMISQLEFVLRNAQSVEGVSCTASGVPSKTLGNTEAITVKNLNTDDVIKYLAPAGDSYLALNDLRINSRFVLAASPVITCYQELTTQKTSVRIKFTLSRTGDSSMKEDFESLIQLRNS